MGRPQQGREEHASATMVVLASAVSYSPRPTLVLARSPSRSMGPRFTYRSVVTSATAAIPFRSLLRCVTLGRRPQQLWAGVDLRTVQQWLGHSDMESTMRYLKPSRSQHVRDKVNEIFA
jgi:hypothetical protein